ERTALAGVALCRALPAPPGAHLVGDLPADHRRSEPPLQRLGPQAPRRRRALPAPGRDLPADALAGAQLALLCPHLAAAVRRAAPRGRENPGLGRRPALAVRLVVPGRRGRARAALGRLPRLRIRLQRLLPVWLLELLPEPRPVHAGGGLLVAPPP